MIKEKIIACIEIIRPWWLPVLLPVLLGPAFIASNGPPPTSKMLLAVLSFSLIKCSATVFNDFFDRGIDRVIHANRPIPSGRISEREAILFGVSLMAIGFFIAIFVNPTFFALAVLTSVFYLLHIWKIKRMISVPGIATAGTSVSISLIVLGGWSIVSPEGPLSVFLALLVFLWDMSHDTASSIRDSYGDRLENLQSFAVAFGNKKAAEITALIFIIALTMGLILSVIIKMHYLMHTVLIVGAVIVFYLIRLIRNPNKENAAAAHGIISWYPIGLFMYIIIALTLTARR